MISNEWSINSERLNRPGREHNIIYEWEDVLSLELGLKVVNRMNLKMEFIDKVLVHLRINPLGHFQRRKAIVFKLSANTYSDWTNSSKIIPWIIDFYLPSYKYDNFFKVTSRNHVVFISSREVYELLTKHKLFDKEKYIHMPLTMPDKYRINGNEHFDKKYDLVMPGRSDSMLMSFVEHYADEHPDFTYVAREHIDGKCAYSVNNRMLGKKRIYSFNSQDAYLDLVKSGKIGLWSTRGLDFLECNGYNQVTPRLLELMTCGCHVIVRYPDNADTRYWRVNEISPSINDYESFRLRMDVCLSSEVDMKSYARYLNSHYTSNLVFEIKKYLY